MAFLDVQHIKHGEVGAERVAKGPGPGNWRRTGRDLRKWKCRAW